MNHPHFPIAGRAGAMGTRCTPHRTIGSASSRGSRTEIENLRRLMMTTSDLTEQRLAQLRDRVAQGIYQTRAAAEETAACLLDEHFDLEV